MNDEILTIKQAADYLKMSYTTVYFHRLEWGFFRMPKSRIWRVHKTTLENQRKMLENVCRLGTQIGDKEQPCRSEKTDMEFGKLISLPQTANEFDAVVKQLTKPLPNISTTN